MKKYKTKTKKYNITQAMIAKWFNYSTPESFRNSTSSKDVMNGIQKVIEYIEGQITMKIEE